METTIKNRTRHEPVASALPGAECDGAQGVFPTSTESSLQRAGYQQKRCCETRSSEKGLYSLC